MFPSVDALIDRDRGRRYSAIVVRIERGGRVVYERAAGTMRDDGGEHVTVDTPFDLASITKVFVATVALAMVQRGEFDFDAPLSHVVPEWRGTRHEPITLRNILAHTAGFRSGADYRTLFNENVEAFALTHPLVSAPGERVVYSDLGFLSLGAIVARRAGVALRTVVESTLRSFGATGVTYLPRVRHDTIPATERDTWRGLVQGRVHDEKAYLAGGVAGHAGLFGDARNVALLGEWYLGPRFGRASPLDTGLALAATREQAYDETLRRGLGWALKTNDENSCGAAMSSDTFGHTGFTGTCVWVDAARDLNVVILTNAVHHGRGDLRDVRMALCTAAVAEFAA